MFSDSYVPCVDCLSEVALNRSQDEKTLQTEPYTIKHRSSQIIRRKEKTRIPIEVAWNSTGVLLSVAFSSVTHDDWCFHSGLIAVWNMAKKEIEPTNPEYVLESSSCIMCTKFHPVLPSLLAGGTFSGEILIWNLSVDSTATVGIASSTGEGHLESVNQIEWLGCASSTPTSSSATRQPGASQNTEHLVSIGSDGRLLVWLLDTSQPTYKLTCVQSYQIRNSDQLPPAIDYVSAKRDQTLFAERTVSLTCLAMSPSQPERLILGTACGGVLLCCLRQKLYPVSNCNLGKSNEIGLQEKSPVELALYRHSGPVTALDWSRFHRNLVLSCAAGRQVQLHNILQRNLAISLDYGQTGIADLSVLTAQFSPIYASLLVCASNNGQISVYTLNTDKSGDMSQTESSPAIGSQPNLVRRVQTEPRSNGDNDTRMSPVMTLAMTRDRTPLIAVASTQGEVNVWKLGDNNEEQLSLFNAPVKIEQLFSHLLLADQ